MRSRVRKCLTGFIFVEVELSHFSSNSTILSLLGFDCEHGGWSIKKHTMGRDVVASRALEISTTRLNLYLMLWH